MHVVAILELATPIEAEAAALAADLGTTAYEERLKIVGGQPAIVLLSAEAEPALALARKIRARGHRAVALDAAEVVASADMVNGRRFVFEPDGLALRDGDARLPFADILALVRAVHRTRTETRSETKNRKFSLGLAVATGGLALTKTVTREAKSVAQERDAILYVFRSSGDTPWIFHERSVDYSALGGALAPSSMHNFMTLIARLREAAPHAVYDERLLAPGAVAVRPVGAAGPNSSKASSASGVDLAAHLIARWARRAPRTPFR